MSSTSDVDGGSKAKPGLELGSLEAKEAGKINTAGLEKSWKSCCFTNIVTFSFYYGVVSLVTSALGAYLTSQVTTLEKQFGLSSSQSGVLLSMNDAGFLITVLFASYFGRNAHIPRILAVCGFVYGVSAFICIIPHFFSNEHLGDSNSASNSTQNVSSDNTNGLCSPERPESSPSDDLDCSEEEKRFTTTKSIAMWLISFGMFLQGMAKAPRQPLSQTYIDDNVSKKKSGLYIGIIIALSVFGPAVSYGIGGSISQIYVTLEETDMNPRDPRWVGAWWLGFMAFGSLALVLSAPLVLFPKRLHNAPPREDNSKSKSDKNVKLSLQSLLSLLKGVLRAALRLTRRPVWILLVIGTGIRVFAVSGISSFTPKYMQIYYGLSVFKANIIIGFVSIGAAAAAIFLSGLLTRLLKLGLRGMIRTIIITQIISSSLFFIGIFLECPQPEVQDFEIHTGATSQEMFSLSARMNTTCFYGCRCDAEIYFPICGTNGLTYFSPCHAGCHTRTEKGYSGCLCIRNGTETSTELVLDAVPGTCQQECSLHIAFVVLSFMSSFIGGLGAVPILLAILRSVDDKDKALGLGVNSFVSSLIGWFLGPIVMGVVIDSTCKLWNRSCSEDGSCALYDIVDLRYKLHGVDAGVSVLYITLYIFAYICLTCSKRGKLYVIDEKVLDIKSSAR